MALPSSGQISMSQVNTELGYSSTAQISLNDSAVRSLAGVPSGAISLDNLHGKSAAWSGTITTNQQEMNLATWAAANGWNGSASATITINAGVYIWSNNTSVAALTTGSFPGGLTIINNGYIIGKGGKGGNSGTSPTNAGSGGPAISTSVNLTIQSSTGYIGGGGGGGGSKTYASSAGGGGAGGGQAGDMYYGTTLYAAPASNPTPGTVGTYGITATDPTLGTFYFPQGGGRIIPGSLGAEWILTNTKMSKPNVSNSPQNAGAQSGGTGSTYGNYAYSGRGGSTGNAIAGYANYGGTSVSQTYISGTGGGWGGAGQPGATSPQISTASGAPGVGGSAVVLNGNSITWTGGFPSGNVFGAVA